MAENEKKFSKKLKFIGKKINSVGNKTLNGIEWIGNKIPKPFFLFLYLIIIIMIISTILSYTIKDGITINNQVNKKFFNFLSAESINWWLTNFITNWTGLSTVGIVLFMTIFVKFSEESGFIDISLRKLVSVISNRFLTIIVILLGTVSSLASDAGYLILIPLAGVMYYRAGRHPLVGIVAAFAGTSSGVCR